MLLWFDFGFLTRRLTFLLVTSYFLLVTRYFLLVTFYFLLITRYFLLVAFYSLLVAFYSLHVTFYSLLIFLSLLIAFLLQHVFNQIRTVFWIPFLERVLELRVNTCDPNARPFHTNFIRLEMLHCAKLFYFEYSMDIGVGLAKLMHRTNIYLPHGTQRGNSFTAGTGLLMSSNFGRPPNNQTKFLEDVKLSAV